MLSIFNRSRRIILWVLAILVLSFAGTDYYLRGQLYYAKRVANFIYLHTWQTLFPPSGPVKLYVRMDADQDYRRLHLYWKSRLPEIFDAVARRFAEEFDIRLTLLSIGAWERPDGLDDYTDILKYAARKLDRRGTDISIIMTGKDAGRAQDSRWVDAGVAHMLGNCVVVGDDALLIHELGHLFGAVDYPPGNPFYELKTTYSYEYAARTNAIDPENRARILKHKYRPLW